MRSPLRSPAQVEGSQGFLPQPEKDLERPSSTRLEARFPDHDSRAMTCSPSPLAWRPDLPGVPRGSLTLPSYLGRIRILRPRLENNPETPPSSRNEGLRLLYDLETNLATSLQTPQEA